MGKEGLQISYAPTLKNGAGVLINIRNLGEEPINNLSIFLDLPEELRLPYTQTNFSISMLEPAKEMSFKVLLHRADINRDLPISTQIFYGNNKMVINFVVPKILFNSLPSNAGIIIAGIIAIAVGACLLIRFRSKILKK